MKTRYKNLNGDSNILYYDIQETYIDVYFERTVYTYSSVGIGDDTLKILKNLAVQGYGLNGFINRYIKYKYSDKKYL